MRYVVVAERTETFRIAVEAETADEAKTRVWVAGPDLEGLDIIDRSPQLGISSNGLRIRLVKPVDEPEGARG